MLILMTQVQVWHVKGLYCEISAHTFTDFNNVTVQSQTSRIVGISHTEATHTRLRGDTHIFTTLFLSDSPRCSVILEEYTLVLKFPIVPHASPLALSSLHLSLSSLSICHSSVFLSFLSERSKTRAIKCQRLKVAL